MKLFSEYIELLHLLYVYNPIIAKQIPNIFIGVACSPKNNQLNVKTIIVLAYPKT